MKAKELDSLYRIWYKESKDKHVLNSQKEKEMNGNTQTPDPNPENKNPAPGMMAHLKAFPVAAWNTTRDHIVRNRGKYGFVAGAAATVGGLYLLGKYTSLGTPQSAAEAAITETPEMASIAQ
jgi:hypothetical protein